MSKLRLNVSKRRFLIGRAIEFIDPEDKKEAARKAWDVVMKHLRKHLDNMVTPSDFKVLDKYGFVIRIENFPFTLLGISEQRHEELIELPDMFFDGGIMWVPKSKNNWNGESMNLGELKINCLLVKAWKKAEEAVEKYEETKRTYQDKITSIINTAVYLEDIIPAWEGAEEYRDKLDPNNRKTTALSVVSEEDIATLRNMTAGKPDNKNTK